MTFSSGSWNVPLRSIYTRNPNRVRLEPYSSLPWYMATVYLWWWMPRVL